MSEQAGRIRSRLANLSVPERTRLLRLLEVEELAVGEIAKVGIAKSRVEADETSASWSALTGSAIAERLTSVAGLGVVAVVAGVLVPVAFALWFGMFALGALAVLALALFVARTPNEPVRAGVTGIRARIGVFICSAWTGVHQSSRGLRTRPATIVGTSVGQWLAVWVATLALLHGFGLGELGWGGAGALMIAFVVGGAVPFMPAGLGPAQIGPALLLTNVYAVDLSTAIAVALTMKLVDTGANVLGGLGFLAWVWTAADRRVAPALRA